MDLISVQSKKEGVFTIKVRNHAVDTEISTEKEGKDSGPNPTELLVGSLGGCIAIMVNSYCKNHGYTDGDVEVSLTYQLAGKPAHVSSIVVDLEIPRDVPENRKKAILKTAHLCPIHKTLTNPPEIDIETI
jgi:putative redox protein